VFLGTVTSVTLTPSGFNANRQATRYALAITIKVEFRDVRADKILWENPSVMFRQVWQRSETVARLEAT